MTDPVNPDEATGPLEGRCGAVRQRGADGTPIRWCRNWPMKGQARCRLDGGKAPQALAAAERRQQEAAAQAYVARYGVPTHIEWHEAIQQGLDETYGNVLALRDLVQQMRPEALTWGETEVRTVAASQFPGIDVTQAAGVTPLVALYGQERDRLHRMANDAGKLGLEARKQAWNERQGALVADVIRAVLAEVGVDPSRPDVMRVVSTQLRALSGAA